MIADLVEYSVMNLMRRSLRSWLTVIGIIIGVFAIVIMVSLAQGLDSYIKAQLSFMGSDTISITPGSIEGGSSLFGAQAPLTLNDYDAIRKIPDIGIIGYTMEGRTPVQYRGENITMYVVGVDPNLLNAMYNFSMETGRQLRSGERGSIVVGYSIAHDTFGQDISVGRRMIVGNKSFGVVGVLSKGGGLTSTLDVVAYIAPEDARLVIPQFQGNRDVTEIDLKVVQGANPDEVADEITNALLRTRKVKADNKNFSVITSSYINQQVGNITAALSLFLGGIAAISLLVGSIGIANTMFMSVMERTREIGVMKALGATQWMIMGIFLVESGIIGVVGGMLGLALSIGVSNVISYFGIPSSVTWWVALGAVAFSFIVGVLAGYIPARNAAKLDAVEALRYE